METLLLEHFDHLISTPEDVEQLNLVILQLAIQGKLLTQNNADEPAAEILKRIVTTKSKLNIKELFLPIGDDEKPFELPKSWEWTRLNDICYQITDGTHYTPKYLYDGVPFLSVKDVSKGFLDFSNTRFISQEEHDLFASRCKPEFGDVILTKVGTTGIAVVVDTEKEFSIFVSLALLKFFQSEISPDYLALVINSPFVKKQSEKYTMGVGNKNLVLKHIKSFPIPLPPFAEQKRIVARVEELFVHTRALAKELANSQSELDVLNKSALSHLLASKTPEEFNQHWHFVAEHFDLLFQAPEHITPLRQSILELAVRGKLTRREAGDESAEELLDKIQSEKAKLMEEGKLRKEKPLPLINSDEQPFELPNDWEWVRLKEITIYLQTGPFGSNLHKSDYVSDGIPVVNPVNMRDGKITINQGMLISESTLKRLSQYILETGDLVLARRGEIGRCALVTERENGWLCGTGSLRLRVSANILNEFILLLFKTDFARSRLTEQTVGITMSNMSQTALENLIFALPPLTEQERIVERVEQLLSLCNALEARLQSAEEERGRLVESVLAAVGS